VVDGFALRYAKVVVPFVIAAAAALANSGCSDEPNQNMGGGGGAGGSEASSSSSSSSSGGGGAGGSGGSGGSSSSSSSGTIDCGDMQTDTMNCGKCDYQCAVGQTCQAGKCTCGFVTGSFAIVQNILTNNCATAGCHSGAAPEQGLDMSAGNAYAALVNKPTTECNGSRIRVIPGKPEESYLMDKVMGIDLCGTTGRMPPLAALSDTNIKLISNWICAGAPTD
jgi:hypothetical protein